jgi:hypothetical protein
MAVWRDPDCDETVSQLTARHDPERHEPLIYSRNVPKEDLERRRIPLACYQTTADEYIKSSLEPIGPPPKPEQPVLKQREKEPEPVLKERPKQPEPSPKEPPKEPGFVLGSQKRGEPLVRVESAH